MRQSAAYRRTLALRDPSSATYGSDALGADALGYRSHRTHERALLRDASPDRLTVSDISRALDALGAGLAPVNAHSPATCAGCEAGRLAAPAGSVLRALADDLFALAIVLGSVAATLALAAIIVAVWTVLT